MLLSTINDSVCIKANLLLGQTNTKKSNKAVVNEISKMSDLFGSEFNLHFYTSLLEEIDFKDFKSPQNSVKTPKIQFLIQEFPNYLEELDFVNTFSMILNNVNLNNNSLAAKITAFEFFDCLTKLCKLNIDNQLKLLIAMNLTSNEIISKDAGKVFAGKCKEIEKEINLSSDLLQMLITLARKNCPENSKIMDLFLTCLYKNTHPCFYNSCNNIIVNPNKEHGNSILESNYLLNDVADLLEDDDEKIDVEKLYHDLGPSIINTNTFNNLSTLNNNNNLLDFDINEKRLASFIIYILRHQQIAEDKETKHLNKVFFKLFESDIANNFDETNDKKSFVHWNIDNFYKQNKSRISSLDQTLVIKNLDDCSFTIKDKKTLDYLLSVLNKLKFNNPLQLLYNFIFKSIWKNSLNQIELITFLLSNNIHDSFPFRNYCDKKVKKLNTVSPNDIINNNNDTSFSGLETGIISINSNTFNHMSDSLCCVDIVKTLVTLSNGNYYLKIKEILNWAIEYMPETLILVFSEFEEELNESSFIFTDSLMKIFNWNYNDNSITQISSNLINLFNELKIKKLDFLIELLLFLHDSSTSNNSMVIILDICQKSDIFLKVLEDNKDYDFTIALALIAAKKEYLNLEQWLSEQISKFGEVFLNAILNYIQVKVIERIDYSKNYPNKNKKLRGVDSINNLQIDIDNLQKMNYSKETVLEAAQLNLESLAIIFKILFNEKDTKQNNLMTKQMSHKINQTYKLIFEIFDELHFDNINTKEVEEQTNLLFDKYFSTELSLEELINVLKQYKSSTDVLKNQILAYLVYSVFDEYRFLNSYPELQLKAMSALLGQLINNKFLDSIIESIALNYIIASFEEKPESNKYKFATSALEQFIDSIQNYSQTFLEKLYKLNLKSNPLFEKINEKYNLIFNKPNNNIGTTINSNASNSFTNNNINPNVNKMYYFNSGYNNMTPNLSNIGTMNNISNININSISPLPQMQNMSNTNYGFNQRYMPEPLTDLNSNNNNNLINNQNHNMAMGSLPLSKNISNTNQANSIYYNNMGSLGNMNLLNSNNTEESKHTVSSLLNSNKKDEETLKFNSESDKKDDYSNLVNSNLNPLNSNQQRPKLKSVQKNPHNQKVSEILNDSIPQAPPEIVGKIKFIFNSMSKTNISEKSKELKIILSNNSDQVLKWFSNYFIIERVSIENNYHSVYSDLIAFLGNKELNLLLITDTITYIKKLLYSERFRKDEIKSVLKNLGSWLGIMTLAKNKPILFKDLDLKEMLLEAYENGKLQIILFFICKILESSAKTKVFHPKSPFIYTLLIILTEVYIKSQIKQNIKCEIEGLFKKLDIDINIFISSVNNNKTKILDSYVMCKDSNDIKNNLDPGFMSQLNSGNRKTKNLSVFDSNGTNTGVEVKLSELYQNISRMENFLDELTSMFKSKQIPLSSTFKNDLTEILAASLQYAIHEILESVEVRAINISFATSKELVKKDFFFEKDPKAYRLGFVNSVKALTGSLAKVTCKEPLRTKLIDYLKHNFQKYNIDPDTIDDLIINISSHPSMLEIGCYFIQEFVVKNAIEKIDKDVSLNEELNSRDAHFNSITSNPLTEKFYNLPSPLKQLINPCLMNEYDPENKELEIDYSYDNTDILKIYSDFDNVFTSKRKESVNTDKMDILRMILPALREFAEQCLTSTTTVMLFNSKLEILLKNIRTLTLDQGTIFEYPDCDYHINELSNVITNLNIDKFFSNNSLTKTEIQDHCNSINNILIKYILHSSKHHDLTLLNFYTEILKGFIYLESTVMKSNNIDYSPEKEITIKLLNSEDIFIRYLPELHYYLLKKEVFDLEEWETFIDYFLKDNSQSILAQKLIIQLSEKKAFEFLDSTEFKNANNPNTKLSVLNKYSSEVFPSESSFKKLNFFMFSSTYNTQYFDLFYVFSKLVKPNTHQKLPLDSRFFKVDKDQFKFIRSNIKAQFQLFVIKMYEKQNAEKVINDMFEGKEEDYIIPIIMILTEFVVIDANNMIGSEVNEDSGFVLPIFVSMLIVKCIESIKSFDKLKLLENALLGIYKVFSADYIKNSNNFNQKPYVRLYSFLIKSLFELKPSDDIFKNCKKFQLFVVISEYLKILNPLNYPAFSIGWLEVISNSYLMSALVNKNFDGKTCIPCLVPTFQDIERKREIINFKQLKYCDLLCEALKALGSMSGLLIKDFNMKFFYDNVLKIFYYLSFSYPEFVSAYYIAFITSFPINKSISNINSANYPVDGFIQIKNIILSAGSYSIVGNSNPTQINFIEFFKDDFKIDHIPDIKKNQEVLYDVGSRLKELGLKEVIDESVFAKGSSGGKLEDFIKIMDVKNNGLGICYFVSYVGINIKPWFESKKVGFPELVEYFSKLVRKFSEENKNILIHSILNEIKCLSPNTYFFVMLTLTLLLELKMDNSEEMLLRNILLRLMVKPYPAGLVWLIRDLIRNKKHEDLVKRLAKSNPSIDSMFNEIINFATDNYKNLENYI